MSERTSYRKMKASSVFSQKADAFGLSLHSTRICCYPQLLDFSFSNSRIAKVRTQPNFRIHCSNAGAFPDNLHQRRFVSFKVHASMVGGADQPKWWEKNVGSNMIDIHSTQEFLGALSQAGDRLVIVEFYGTWCASCRALFPKICKIAVEHPEILFLKVNFDENKSLCKSLNLKALPYFQFYRGANGLLESFPCSLAKLQKLKDAIATHSSTCPSSSDHPGICRASDDGSTESTSR